MLSKFVVGGEGGGNLDKIQKNRPHICHVEKCQIYVKNLNNLWSFIKIYAVFVLNLCGEKSVWRPNDKYEVCQKVADGTEAWRQWKRETIQCPSSTSRKILKGSLIRISKIFDISWSCWNWEPDKKFLHSFLVLFKQSWTVLLTSRSGQDQTDFEGIWLYEYDVNIEEEYY